MVSDTKKLPGWDELASGDRELLAHHAGAALERRGKDFFRARRALWIDWLLTGGIGLFGLLVLHWASATAALLVIAGFWLGWLADLVLWLFRRTGLALSYQRTGDDMRLWQIVAILRGKRRQAPDVRGHPTLGLSLIVDLVAGGAATLLLLQGLQSSGVDTFALSTSPALLTSIALIAAVGIVPGLRARFTPAIDGSVQLPVFSVGQRGIGLLVLVFALMAASGGALSSKVLMCSAYGFFILMAAIELIWGLPELRREAEWLREHRAGTDADRDGRG